MWTIAPDVLRHRIILSYEALAEDVTAELVVEEVRRKIPLPRLGLAGEEGSPYQKEQILPANTAQQEAAQRRWRLPGRRGTETAQKRERAQGQEQGRERAG